MSSEWYDFLENVRNARKQLGNPEIVWYRGHSSGEWKLIPSLHRLTIGLDREKALFEDFYRLSLLMSKKWDNDWETLFDMQHYGVPTRLLDWTETLGVAVAFAVLDHHASHGDLAIYILDPVKLNKKSGLRKIKEIPDNKFEYKAVYWNSDPFSATFPIAIAPPFQNARMLAQSGTFTIHGSEGGAVEDLVPDAVIKVQLPESTLQGAYEFIEYADLNPHKIYPDLLGITRHLNRKHLGK
jgi:hypothetical protein